MSFFFHRNLIKKSTELDFNKRTFPISTDSQMICSLLKQNRIDLLKYYGDPSQLVENVQKKFENYISMLLGFINDLSGSSNGDSKLRHAIKPKWTESLHPFNSYEEQDAIYEMISIIINNALWLSKHAAYVAATVVEPSEKEAKEIHKCLKQSAGQFKYVQDNLINKLIKTDSNQPQAYADVNDLILSTYINQCKAEAQEITIARAIELKHSPSLICSIAQSTSILFQSASDSLSSLDKNIAEKWSKYFALKSRFYKSQAYCYFGQDLLAQDKCGDAIRCFEETQKFLEETRTLCNDYSRAKGHGTKANPALHKFFTNFETIVLRLKEKSERENNLIYHQHIPIVASTPEVKNIESLSDMDEFKLPDPHKLWTSEVYSSFDLSKSIDKSPNQESINKKEQWFPEKEIKIPQESDQTTSSFCDLL